MHISKYLLSVFVLINVLFSPYLQPSINKERLNYIDTIVNKAIAQQKLPGAVILVGHDKEIVYQKAFGFRAVEPTKIPMTLDTIFDVASLTKVVATTTLALQLIEQGQLGLTDKIATYIPAFGVNGKQDITIEQLMTHRSGLAPDLPVENYQHGKEEAFKRLWAQPLVCPPTTKCIYSCSNFIILGNLIEQLAGKSLDVLAQENIFGPLDMKDTGFLPETHPSWAGRIAPADRQPDGSMLCGQVHDPSARLLGGVAGNAGLFSTASDLAIFCTTILKFGNYDSNKQLLGPLTIERMISQGTTPDNEARGLGWDINTPPHSFPRGDFFPLSSFGHTGFTGTSIWIDPDSQTFIIFLSNRLHPDGKGDVKDLRYKIASIVAGAVHGEDHSSAFLDTSRKFVHFYC